MNRTLSIGMNQKVILFALAMLLTFACLSPVAFGQGAPPGGQIRGTLIDAHEQPGAEVVVYLRSMPDSSLQRTVISQQDGKFLIEAVPNGKYIVEISGIGLERVFVADFIIDDSQRIKDCGSIRVKEGATQLKEAKITGVKSMVEKYDDRVVVNLDKSIASDGSSLMDVIAKFPGVMVMPDGQLALNGKQDVKVFLDGKLVMLSAQELTNLLKGTPTSNVDKVEIMNKPSAKFDAAGSGGVINIIRKRGQKTGLNGSAELGAGTGRYEKLNSNVKLSWGAKGLNTFFSLGYLRNKMFRRSDAHTIFDDPALDFNEYKSVNNHIRTYNTITPTIGLDYAFSRRFVVSFLGSGQFQSFDNKSNSLTDASKIGNNTLYQRLGFQNISSDQTNNLSFNTHFGYKLDSLGSELSGDFDYGAFVNKSNQNIENTFSNSLGQQVDENDFLLNQKNNLHIYAAKLDYTKVFSKSFTVDGGLKVSKVTNRNDNDYYDRFSGETIIDSAKGNYFKYAEQITSAYLNTSKKLQKASILLGVRLEHTNSDGEQILTGESFSRSYLQLFPSLLLSYYLNKNGTVSLRASRRIDRPAYQDLNPLVRFVNTTSSYQGNPYLRPQTSQSLEVSYSYKNFLTFGLGASLYNNFITTWIYQDGSEGNNITLPVNVGKVTSYNVDISFSRKITPWWMANSSFSGFMRFFKGGIEDYAIPNKNIPAFYINGTNSFLVTDKLSFELSFLYLHRMQNGGMIYKPNYTMGIGARRTLFGKKGSLSINLSDLLKTEGFSWALNTGSISDKWKIRNDTRVVRFNFTYNFGGKGLMKLRSKTATDDEKRRAIIK